MTDSDFERASGSPHAFDELRRLVAGYPFALLVVDRTGTVVACNRAAERLLVVDAADVVGDSVKTVLPALPMAVFDTETDSSASHVTGYTPLRVEGRRGDGTTTTLAVGLERFDRDGFPVTYLSLADADGESPTRSALRDTEARYQSLVESLPLNVLRKDLQGRFTFANQRCLKLLRVSLEDLVGKTDADFFPPQLAAKYRADDERVIATGEVFEDVEEHLGAEGMRSYVQVLKAPLLNARGEIVGIQGMFWDVSPRKRAEQGLLESEARKRSVLQAAIDAIVMARDDGTIVEFNTAAERTFEFSAEEVHGRNLVDTLFPERVRDDVRAIVNGLQNGESSGASIAPSQSERFETEGCRRDGSTFVAEVSLRLIPVEERPALVVFIRDVTERHVALASIERERFLLRSLMDHVPDNVYFKDREGRYLRINKAKARQSGLANPEEAVGKTDFDFFDDAHAQQARDDEVWVMKTGLPIVGKDERLVWPGGDVSWSSTTKVPLRDEQGKIVGTFGISRDVTDQKRVEVALREAAEAAEAANRAKSDFLANTSHEIRTPMNAVIGMTELLLDDEESLTSRQREFLGIVHDSAEGLLDVINDILDFSKIEAGHVELDEEEFDVRDLLGDTVKSLAVRAHRKGLEVAFRCDRSVPRRLIADATRLRQIVVNLVGNAIKFTERGEILLDISAESLEDGRTKLNVSVHDTGIGIPAEKLGRIFEAFEQVDTSTSRRFGGTGLGLAISSQLVALLGGEVDVDSEEGRGSTFHFAIPCRAGESTPPEAPSSADLGGMRVLVVDDNATNRRILEEMLRGWEMQPLTVGSAAEAVVELDRVASAGESFPLVLSDVNMPERDGFSVAEHIQSAESHARTVIVMLTSGDRPEDVDRCDVLGVSGYLIKPVKQSELFDAIGSAIGATRTRKPLAEPPAPATVRTRPLDVLLAEDSLPNQKLAVRLLERWGHTVTVCENGLEAIDHVRRGRFDLVLMDVQMPELDGLEATRIIRRDELASGRHVPIIAMTAHAMPEDRERCLDSGMDEYISKPIRAPLLQRTIAEITGAGVADETATLPSGVTSGRLVDWTEGLRVVGGDTELLLEVGAALLEESEESIAGLESALSAGDAAGVAHWAHRIKGGLRSIAAITTYEVADAIESAARDGDVETARRTARELLSRFPTIVAEIDHARAHGIPRT